MRMWAIVQCVRYCLCGFMFYLGYIMLRDSVPYGAWMFVLSVLGLLFGGHNFHSTTTATCPKCGHTFEVTGKKDANTQA